MRSALVIFSVSAVLCSSAAFAALPPVGAAPSGDATDVASRIIKYNFPECKHVSDAVRRKDGAIRAKCDDANYLVFTLFNQKEGKLLELALNCTAAKKVLNVAC
jgi:hypothetical protein